MREIPFTADAFVATLRSFAVSATEMTDRFQAISAIQISTDTADEPTELEKARQRSRDDLAAQRRRGRGHRRESWR